MDFMFLIAGRSADSFDKKTGLPKHEAGASGDRDGGERTPESRVGAKTKVRLAVFPLSIGC